MKTAYQYFSYDALNCPALQFHATETEAKGRAEKSIEEWDKCILDFTIWRSRSDASEGPELIDNPICWGIVKQSMMEISRRILPKEEAQNKGWDEEVDYDLRDVP